MLLVSPNPILKTRSLSESGFRYQQRLNMFWAVYFIKFEPEYR